MKVLGSEKGRFDLLRNFVAMVLMQAGNFLVPLITLPFLSRTLGVEAFGTYSFSLAVMVAMGVIVEWGFPLCATANVAAHRDDPQKLAEFLNTTVSAKIALAVLTGTTLAVFSFVMEPFKGAQLTLFCAFGLVLANVCNLGWYLQGLERMALFATCMLLARLTTIPAILMLVHTSEQAWLACLIQSIAALFGASLSFFLVARSGSLQITKPKIRDIMERLNEARHFFLAAAAINLYTASTVIIVGLVREPAAVAVYAGADRIKSAAQNIITPLSQVFYPRVVNLFVTDPDRARVWIKNLIFLFGSIGFIVAAALFFYADFIVLLLLGDGFEEAAKVLRVLAPIPMLSALANVLSVQAMGPLGMVNIRSRILIAIAVLSVLPTIWMSTIYGPLGAATIVLFCEFAGLITFYIFVGPKLRLLSLLQFKFRGKTPNDS